MGLSGCTGVAQCASTETPEAVGSVALTIPRDFAAAMDLHVGDFVEIEPLDSQRLAVRKARAT